MDDKLPAELDRLVRECHGGVRRYLAARLQRLPVRDAAADADDLTQEVFRQIVSDQRRGAFVIHDPSAARSYLYQRVRLVLAKYVERRGRRSATFHVTTDLASLPDQAADDGQAAVDRHDQVVRLVASMRSMRAQGELTPEQFRLLSLHYHEGRSPGAIGEGLGQTGNAITLRIRRIMARIAASFHEGHDHG